MTEPEVLLRTEGHLGRITLNRPRAINALTHDMTRCIDEALRRWEVDDSIATVLIDGAGERGLCAGGDIRSIYDDARSGGSATLGFWADEYRLNARIARYPKPYIAVMDGLVMGGGVGISAHGSLRIVTERSRIGLPEVGIGLVPDVGATYLLARAPGEVGTHIALTGAVCSAEDAIHCGLADHFVPTQRLADLTTALATWDAATAVGACADPPDRSPLAEHADWIDRCYAGNSVQEILARLRDDAPEAKQAAAAIGSKSPMAVTVALQALRNAAHLPDLESVLEQEFRVSRGCLEAPDLVEGIRAQIVDKDRNPRWSPATFDAVSEAMVAACFAPRPGSDLVLERKASR